MLIINCNKGRSESEENDICISIINMKTNKKVINYTEFSKEVIPYRRFIEKDNEDLYFFKGNEDKEIHLNIEIFTGKINIDIKPNNNIKQFEFGNKLLYIIPRNTDINIEIKGLINSVYSIHNNYDIYYEKDEILNIGSNYLFNLEKDDVIDIIPEDL